MTCERRKFGSFPLFFAKNDCLRMEATLTKYLKRSPVVLLPALALVALLLSAIVASLFSWGILYRNVVPNAGKREAVYLQYG